MKPNEVTSSQLERFTRRRFETIQSAASLAVIATLACSQMPTGAAEVPEGVWVRPGYRLTVAESTIKGPRFMAFGQEGQLFVSVPSAGKRRSP